MSIVKKAEHTKFSGPVRQPLVKIGCWHPAQGMIQKQSVRLTMYLCVPGLVRRGITASGHPYYQPANSSRSKQTKHLMPTCSPQAPSSPVKPGCIPSLDLRSATSVWSFHVPVPLTCIGSARPGPSPTHSYHVLRPCLPALKAHRSKVHGVQGHAVQLIASPLFFCVHNPPNIGYFRAPRAGTSIAQKTLQSPTQYLVPRPLSTFG